MMGHLQVDQISAVPVLLSSVLLSPVWVSLLLVLHPSRLAAYADLVAAVIIEPEMEDPENIDQHRGQ